LTFDILTLKVVSESRVTWATSVPILVFLDLSVLDLGPMYTTGRQTDVRQYHHLMPLLGGGDITKMQFKHHYHPLCALKLSSDRKGISRSHLLIVILHL